MTKTLLIRKFSVFIIPVLAIIWSVVVLWILKNSAGQNEQAVTTDVKLIALNGALQINGSIFENIRDASNYNDQSYQQIFSSIQRFRTANKLAPWQVKTLRRKRNVTEFVVTAENRNRIGEEYNLWGEMNPTINNGEVSIRGPYMDAGKKLITAFAPIQVNASRIVGLLQVDLDMSGMSSGWKGILLPVATGLITSICGILIVMLLVVKKLQASAVSVGSYLNNLAEGELSLPYSGDETDYLSEIKVILTKLQNGIKRRVENEEDKEKLQKQIKELLRIVSAAAEGDFTVTARVTADTLGALADSFNLMVSDLSELIKDVKKSADHITQFTRGILPTTAEMTIGAGNQAKEIENTRILVREVATSADNTDQSARRASESARLAKDVAERGGDILKKSIEGMHRIRETVLDTSRQVRLLADNSARISNITGFISDIAKRTNLLALNATIEAARAGDSARGFSVVADEVRNLAERARRAASEITKLTEDIEAGTSEVMMAMELGNREVAEGTKMVDQAGAALREILEAVDISAGSVEEITKTTHLQLKSSEDIVTIMEKIASIAQQTADGAKKSEISITELETLSSSLNNAVSKFKLA